MILPVITSTLFFVSQAILLLWKLFLLTDMTYYLNQKGCLIFKGFRRTMAFHGVFMQSPYAPFLNYFNVFR